MPKINSEKGKQILAHAMDKEYCVIEFSETDEDGMVVADITQHVKSLEEMLDLEEINARTE